MAQKNTSSTNKTTVDLNINASRYSMYNWSSIAKRYKGVDLYDLSNFEWMSNPPEPKPLVKRFPWSPKASSFFGFGFGVPTKEPPLPGEPDYEKLAERLKQKGLRLGSPIFIRVFKEENELELWLQNGNEFELFETYPICYWSGGLGPKRKQGDKQAPEGFYTVSRGRLNPNSKYHLAFNLGYPNVFDRAHNRSGDFLMVHGKCVSIGCYAMTDRGITEIWKFVTAAFEKGQKNFHVHAYPFRMTDSRLMQYYDNPWFDFWLNLKRGYDLFEITKTPPLVSVCNKKYVIQSAPRGSIGNQDVTNNCSADNDS